MADLKKITLPSGTTYNIVDQGARDLIAALEGATAWIGVTTTPLTDGATTNPIVVAGETITAKTGNMVAYGKSEFVFDGTKWQEFGDLSALGDLAYKDSATGSYTPAGTVSQPTFTGDRGTVETAITNLTFKSWGQSFTGTEGSISASYTPAGTISKPNIHVTADEIEVNSLSSSGTLPTASMPKLSMTVVNETLTFGWTEGSFDPGTLPEADSVTVETNILAELSSAPVFTGTAGTATGAFTPAGTLSKPEFVAQGTTSGSFTPSGTVSQPTFTGTSATIEVD